MAGFAVTTEANGRVALSSPIQNRTHDLMIPTHTMPDAQTFHHSWDIE
jgi:hypothetical protein